MEITDHSFPYPDTFALLSLIFFFFCCCEGAGLATAFYRKNIPANFSVAKFLKSRLSTVVGISIGILLVSLLPMVAPTAFGEMQSISLTPFPYQEVAVFSVVSALMGILINLINPTLFERFT